MLLFAACKKKDSNDGTSAQGEMIVLTTAIPAGSNIQLSIDAAASDRADLWVDLNTNGIKDAGEAVMNTSGALYVVPASGKITVHGKVTRLGASSQRISSLDVSKNPSLVSLICSGNMIPGLDLSKNTALIELDCSKNRIGETAMASLLNSLPDRTGKTGGKAYVQFKEGADDETELNAAATPAQIDNGVRKNWLIYNSEI